MIPVSLLLLPAGGVFVSSVYVVKFQLPVRESRTPSSEGSFRKAPRHLGEKSAGCFVFGETVCDVFNVNLGELIRVPKKRHLAGFCYFTGGVFAFQAAFPHDDALQTGG